MLSEETVRRLRIIQAHILEEPNRIGMQDWLTFGLQPGNIFNHYRGHLVPKCGTVGCIGGWASILFEDKQTKSAEDDGGYYDSYIFAVGENSNSLFYTEEWPTWLRESLNSSTSQQDYANVVSEAIDRFIDNGGSFWCSLETKSTRF